jgi:hypothetical protein
MARAFSSSYIQYAAGPLETQATTTITLAAVFVPPAVNGAWQAMLAVNTSGAADGIELSLDNFGCQPFIYDSSGQIASGFQAFNTDGWTMLAATLTASQTTFHYYVYATNTWTHTTAAGSSNPDPAGTGGAYIVGRSRGTDAMAASTWAAGAIWFRELQQGEIERLPRGNWWTTTPAFHVEFPSGVDNPTLTKDVGRYGLTQSTVSGTARAAFTDPPGFRFSPLNRRR